MGKSIVKLSTNYVDIMKHILKVGPAFYANFEDPEELAKEIEKDVPRTVTFSRTHSFEDFVARWRGKDRSKSFTQGNFTGGNITRTIVLKHTSTESAAKNAEEAGIDESDFYSGVKDLSLAFIDTDGNNCALSIAYQKEAPEFFTISYIRHTLKDPHEREVLFFQGTDNKIYPSLEEIVGDLNDEALLINKSTLKQHLLGIEGLPEEVKLLINDVVDNKGQLNCKSLDEYIPEFKASSTNDGVFFSMENDIKQDLAVYQLFCQNTKIYLNSLINDPQKKMLSLDKLKVKELQRLIKKLNETEERINHVLKMNESKPQAGELSLYNQHQVIQAKIIEFLKQADVSKPYQKLLNDLDKQFQYTHQTFWERRKGSVITSSAISVLLIAGIALTATGVLAPAGLAVIFAVNIVLALATIVSWGLTIDKEISFAEDQKSFARDVKKEIQHEELTKGFSKSTLDLYLRHADSLADTPAAKLSSAEQTFFHKTIKDMDKPNPVEQQKETLVR